ncbi:UNVERIFIED_CONTAM: Sodium/calcium exchanger NCL [Sesamum radiatum]|uniref:Sodium/calcium exchanger NCL n=1 Tax=Sesamum radiatum TaxID=300843 RepID=A0AAW2K2P5_SESRA
MASQPKHALALVFILVLCGLACARLIPDQSDLISDDGVVGASKFPPLLRLPAAEEVCEQTYGFMPCTSTALGNLFLILVYGYLMFLAATYLSNGSELLLEILGPGIVGGLFLPVLGALPDAMLILVSGLSGSRETAQSQVSVGMGLLAGSTVMLLTLIWGTCIIVGKCDIENSVAVDSKDTKAFSLAGSGISTDIWTSYASIIMAISVFQPMVQRRRIAYAKHKHVVAGILKHLKMHAFGKLFGEDGKPNVEVLRRLFRMIDDNKDGYLSHTELRALIVGIRFSEINLDEDDAVVKLMKDLDSSRDSRVDLNEFISTVARWLEEAKGAKAPNHTGSMKFIDDFHEQTRREHDLLGDQGDEAAEGVDNPRWTSVKAVLLLLLGTVIAAVFADPLVDAVDNFSTATSIPSFFISFIVLPLATNSSEAVSAVIFASRKNLRSASLTFSELYGAVTMNNVLCLSVFLALVYVRGLVWDFSSEVLVILIVCVVMGVFASIRTTFPLWTSLLAFLLYPFSLALVYVLDYVFGWS